MHFWLVFGLCIPSIVFGQTVNQKLAPGVPYSISNPAYPGATGWQEFSLEWNLEVEQNSNIKIVCRDIRMVQRGPWTEDCPNVYFSVTDGKGERKVCGGGIHNFVHVSDGSKLKVKAGSTSDGNALISCTAMNNGEPTPEEIVRLEPNGRAKLIKIFYDDKNKAVYLDRLWKFESPEGTRMSFQCDIRLSRISPTCGFSILTLYNGVNDEEYCAGDYYTWFSKTNRAKVRFHLDEHGHGGMDCIIQAVTGPNANEYENVVSAEVDSSEHGVTQGSRKTSCKCGWANKRGARIINGDETKVNEFPWMVHMNMLFETDIGSWTSTCGASIVTPRHIVTAAHCVVTAGQVIKPENVKLILAKHDERKPTGKEVEIAAERIFVPQIFLDKGLSYHDIAVIFTKETISFNDIIGPICIEPSSLPVTNRQATIMGWGLTEKYVASPYLKKAKVRVMDTSVCRGSPWDVCTATEPKNFCSGDSGGPVVWLDKDTNRYSQISVVSRVPGSCSGKYPSFSTQIAYFYNWLQEIIKDTDQSVMTCNKI